MTDVTTRPAAREYVVRNEASSTLERLAEAHDRRDRAIANALALIAGIGLGLSIGSRVRWASRSRPSTPPEGGSRSSEGLTGLSGTYMPPSSSILLVHASTVARRDGGHRSVSFDWHRTVGGWPIALIALHVVFITLGYAEASHVGVVSEFWTFIMHYPDMLTATVAFVLLIVAGVSSIPAVRRTMRYQTWWAVHLYLYLALVLAFAHEIKTGVMFIGHPLALDFWIALFGAAPRSRLVNTNSPTTRQKPSPPIARVERERRRRPGCIRS